jgi:hypothetical protein
MAAVRLQFGPKVTLLKVSYEKHNIMMENPLFQRMV